MLLIKIISIVSHYKFILIHHVLKTEPMSNKFNEYFHIQRKICKYEYKKY